MKKTLIRAISFFLTLSLLTGLLIPFASAIEYEGVESMTVDATAALLIDLDTDQVLYEQAADEQRYPASITKIMTALLTLEAIGRGELDLNTEITVDAAALADITEDSSTANLQAGEKITVKNLLYCLLLASANEAANVLAMAVSGDIPTFVELMNQRAQELGMAGTHFVNPHGLHNADHYSTARDIYRMSKQAMTHATFREIVSTGRYTVPATNLSQPRKLLNTNGLLTSAKHYGYTMDGTIGIKTGSTGEAGYCLVAAVQKKGHTLVSVVLGAQTPRTAGAMSSASNSLRASGCSTGALPISPTPPCWMRRPTCRSSLSASLRRPATWWCGPPGRFRSWSPGPMTRSGWSSAFASTGMWPPPPLKRGMSWAPSP